MLLPVFAVLILTWFFVAVYFESYSSLQESFDKNLGVGLTVYNTIGLVVLTYLVFTYYGVLLVEMTPPYGSKGVFNDRIQRKFVSKYQLSKAN